MAEHILRRELDALGFDHQITITSAGIAPYARDGALVSLDTRMALREVGIADLEACRHGVALPHGRRCRNASTPSL